MHTIRDLSLRSAVIALLGVANCLCVVSIAHTMSLDPPAYARKVGRRVASAGSPDLTIRLSDLSTVDHSRCGRECRILYPKSLAEGGGR